MPPTRRSGRVAAASLSNSNNDNSKAATTTITMDKEEEEEEEEEEEGTSKTKSVSPSPPPPLTKTKRLREGKNSTSKTTAVVAAAAGGGGNGGGRKRTRTTSSFLSSPVEPVVSSNASKVMSSPYFAKKKKAEEDAILSTDEEDAQTKQPKTKKTSSPYFNNATAENNETKLKGARSSTSSSVGGTERTLLFGSTTTTSFQSCTGKDVAMEDSCHETTIKKKTNAEPKTAAKKQKKKKKDPNAPKRPMNAFLLYTNANRARIKAENPDVMYTAIPGIASAEFKSLNKKEKSKWDKSAVEDKARYQAEMEDYEPPEEEEGVEEEDDLHNNNDANDTNNNNHPLADGNGNLNQPSWTLDYAPTGRATCRTCDTRIAKGEVRAGHQPLFRGKPGYVVYRHLHCVVFPTEVNCIQDVAGYNILTQGDCDKLVERIAASKLLIAEENEELCPDELVNDTTAQMSNVHMHPQPSGLIATLLPFQLEGYNWMVNQEVSTTMLPPIRGGILADEMGMGKTIQTIATLSQHRPLLQHAIPGMKHNPTCNDINERIHEETLWDEALKDWNTEMDLLNIPKKFRSGGKNGGARRRAGTLIICPVIALTQWRTEIEKFTELGTLTVCTYHGPDRESTTPRELLTKYDIVLTTYQVLEQDFRKMTSPNRVECPNCGSKFKIDKLPIHLKYFCGDSAERTEAQSRQRRNPDRDERGGGGGGGGRNGGQRRRRGNDSGGGDTKKKGLDKSKDDSTKVTTLKKSSAKTKGANMKLSAAIVTTKNVTPKKPPKAKSGMKKPQLLLDVDSDDEQLNPRAGSPRRSAAVKAASQISRSAAEWMPEDGDDDNGPSSSDSDGENESNNSESSSSDDDSELDRAREKQRQELEMCKSGKKSLTPAALKSAKKGKTITKKKQQLAVKGKGKAMPKKKKFDDEFSDDSSYDSTDDESDDDSTSGDDAINEIDMAALVEKAMAGAKNSVLHSLCWWRIVLDEAHFIKSRSSQTANAAFSLIGIHRWALSGTPLQNRVGEFYSLVRFLRLDPMAYYYCKAKGCDCKSMHYRMMAGVCQGCNHGSIQHYSHFNRYVLNPIQRDGYSGDGRRAMFILKNEVLDKALLRRTKDNRASDMELPPRLVQIKEVRLHPVEEDFYSALYTQTKSTFDDYVASGTLLNNYAHIFDLLIRMRQSVDHPYLVVYSKKNLMSQDVSTQPETDATPSITNGSVDCDLCHEPPTDRVVSTCCESAYCRACVLEYMATTTNAIDASSSLTCPSCHRAFSIDLQQCVDIEDDSSLKVYSEMKKNGGTNTTTSMPSLKELQHVSTGSILRRINLAEFATSSKIEALTRELVQMRQTSPGSKAIVFSQFVNMLDLIRWRLHSDPYLEDIGLGCRALHGGMNVKARDACLKDFREDNNVRVLLMSLKAGGVALNLTCANYIYLMDPWWNPAAEMQAIDRTHRLGQYRPIRAVRFIAENTVEERILQLQDKKRLVFDGTVGRDAASLKMLTVDDMKSLFA